MGTAPEDRVLLMQVTLTCHLPISKDDTNTQIHNDQIQNKNTTAQAGHLLIIVIGT